MLSIYMKYCLKTKENRGHLDSHKRTDAILKSLMLSGDK